LRTRSSGSSSVLRPDDENCCQTVGRGGGRMPTATTAARPWRAGWMRIPSQSCIGRRQRLLRLEVRRPRGRQPRQRASKSGHRRRRCRQRRHSRHCGRPGAACLHRREKARTRQSRSGIPQRRARIRLRRAGQIASQMMTMTRRRGRSSVPRDGMVRSVGRSRAARRDRSTDRCSRRPSPPR
jgi:hypothetical protein